MEADCLFCEPRETRLNLGLSCVIACGSFIPNSINESTGIPCTISCVSRLIDLKRLRHPNIARYLDAQCDKHRRIYIVAEYYCSNFSQLNPPVKSNSDFNWIIKRFQDCLQGLLYLESNGIVSGNLNPMSLLIDNNGIVKIANYGTFYASRWGLDLDFPVVDLKYSSPEALIYAESCTKQSLNSSITEPSCPLDSRSDLWSIALIFTEILHFPLQSFYPKFLLQSLFKSLNTTHSFFDDILSDQAVVPQLDGKIEKLDAIFRVCLTLDARMRPCLSEVKKRFSELFTDLEVSSFGNPYENLECKKDKTESGEDFEKALQFLRSRDDPAECYYYWQLAGGGIDLAAAFLKGVNGNDYLRPPILRLPTYLTLSPPHGGHIEVWSQDNQPTQLKYCPTIVPLPAERLLKRLGLMPTRSLYPLLFPHTYSCFDKHTPIESLKLTGLEKCWNLELTPSHLPKHELIVAQMCDVMAFQPTLVKQADVEYQVMRVCLIRRLLRGMPSTATRLLLEARFDIPPFLRAEVWSALLGVKSGYSDDMNRQMIETALSLASTIPTQPSSSSSTTTEYFHEPKVGLSDQVMSQISVDLPRCHAYDLLIGSPLGQHRLRSVLVAALLANENRFEYTQGMDSLAAVFTRLFFSDPTSATHCLANLLTSPRLVNFFTRRRFTTGLQAYFSTLLRLLAFHVPSVAAHFARLGVPLTGLTAGWMYTLFAHSMPLDRTEILWDRLLASPSPLPMLVYVAIFHQVNQQYRLLKLNQESICTLLSNFPDFNLDQCLEDALMFAAATPISLTVTSQQQLQQEERLQYGDGHDNSWMNHLTRSLQHFNQTHTKMLSTYAESSMSANGSRNQRRHCLNCLFTWTTNMDAITPSSASINEGHSNDVPNQQQTPAPSPSVASNRSDIDYRRINSSLVPLIDPADALQQLSRTDVVLVDMRSKEDYTRGCLMQSIHYTFTDEFEAGALYLTSSQVWLEATIVRNSTNPRGTTINALSPGLVMILQRSTNSADELHDAASSLACCLIQHAIDRVCVIRGGTRALFSLPQITDYFVSPRT
nr:TBC domain containing protein kinase [Hymenolepis microstoma]